VLAAATDGAIMAGPVGTTPPIVDGGQWTWMSHSSNGVKVTDWSSTITQPRHNRDSPSVRSGHTGKRWEHRL